MSATSSGRPAPSHAWQSLYPPIACHRSGWLQVGGGHAIHWEECGNPQGIPALFLHGGPGAGCSPDDRRWFDPARYRIVLFDQRACGRSLSRDPLAANTTADLLVDIEWLRRHLHVERWLLFGGSWGATLALAYAVHYPHRVLAMVLRGVFAASADERRWLHAAEGAGRLQPEDWDRFVAPLASAALHGGDLLAGYRHALQQPDPAARAAAARAWHAWEQALMAHEDAAGATPAPLPDPDAALLAGARVGVHYARHAYFLAEGHLLAQAHRLEGIPGVIVQGALDRVTPPRTALALQRAWPQARLELLARAGHASRHPDTARALIDATDRLADRWRAARPSSFFPAHHKKETTHERRFDAR